MVESQPGAHRGSQHIRALWGTVRDHPLYYTKEGDTIGRVWSPKRQMSPPNPVRGGSLTCGSPMLIQPPHTYQSPPLCSDDYPGRIIHRGLCHHHRKTQRPRADGSGKPHTPRIPHERPGMRLPCLHPRLPVQSFRCGGGERLLQAGGVLTFGLYLGATVLADAPDPSLRDEGRPSLDARRHSPHPRFGGRRQPRALIALVGPTSAALAPSLLMCAPFPPLHGQFGPSEPRGGCPLLVVP